MHFFNNLLVFAVLHIYAVFDLHTFIGCFLLTISITGEASQPMCADSIYETVYLFYRMLVSMKMDVLHDD